MALNDQKNMRPPIPNGNQGKQRQGQLSSYRSNGAPKVSSARETRVNNKVGNEPSQSETDESDGEVTESEDEEEESPVKKESI